MQPDKQKTGALSNLSLIIAIVFTLAICYWHLAPWLAARGVKTEWLDKVIILYRNFLSDTLTIKLLGVVFIIATGAMRTGKRKDSPWSRIIAFTVSGLLIYMYSPRHPILFTAGAAVGFGLLLYGVSLLFRRMRGGGEPEEDSFLQTDELINTEYSVNIPYHYTYKHKLHKAWINIVAPFRASMVLGVPGSGKSFAIYNKCIQDMVSKSYTIFLYDYKFPDLTEELLTEIAYQTLHEGLWKDDKVKPRLYILNFDDPKKSNRCNPIHHTYITDPADTTEIADLIFKNINKGGGKQGFDFFNESAKVYLDALAWFLANYDPDAIYDADGVTVIGSSKDYKRKGIYCTFPHIIELMAYNYKKVFQILQYTKGLEAKISPFASALEGGAMEQLQGQIASAQIPMGKFVSPALYWIMTGDDFTLDINDPEDPKIVCMGNNPDRQGIYGSALALYTSRMFKLINHKHKRHSAVMLDELPTVFIKGLDNLIATARSNKVAIILGAQDKSQLRRDYGREESDVIFTTVGNILSGQVNEETAKGLSEMFGKEFRERQSKTINDDSDSTSISFQLEEILPASKIGTLSQGTFVGRVADNFETPIERKLFCGSIDVDTARAKAKKEIWQKVPVITNFFGESIPEMPQEDEERLGKLWPKLKDKKDKLHEKYLDELINKAVQENFNKVKKDIEVLVENEYGRTLPLAQAAKEAAEMDE